MNVSRTFGKKSTYSIVISLSKKSRGREKLLFDIADKKSFLSYSNCNFLSSTLTCKKTSSETIVFESSPSLICIIPSKL